MTRNLIGGRQDAEPTRSRPGTVRIVLSFIGAAIVLAGAYAWYALRRIDDFVARDIRGLATLASQMGRGSRSATVPTDAESAAMARPLFAQSFLSVFDVVLLATPQGEVLYQTATTQPSPLPTLFAVKDRDESTPLPSSGIILTNLASLEESGSPLKVERLRGSSRRTEVHLMDDDYYLFTHPVRFTNHTAVPPAANASNKSDGADLLVGALVPKQKLRLQAVPISNSKLSIVLGIVILLFCWYPYLRILVLPPGAPLRPVGVVIAAVAALGAGAILTLMLADTLAFQHLSDEEDAQLARYGQKLRNDILRDILRSVVLSEGLRDWSQNKARTKSLPPRIDHLENEVEWKIPAIWQQPYFQRLVWLDREGKPIVTAASKGAVVDPPVSMKDRAFFRDAMLGRWRTIGEEFENRPSIDHRYIVEISHGLPDPEVTIAVPANNNGVIGVTVPFIHFIDPVVPPGFGFAVIDENGTVVFHSEKQRSLNENLFKETDDNRHLRASVYTRRQGQINGRYWGVDHQLYVSPIPGTPWTAVAMRDETLLRTINTEAIALSILLMALYALLYAGVFVLLAIFNPTYRAPWLWPEEDREPEYVRAVWALLLECVAFIACILVIGPPEILAIALFASMRGLATVFVIINRTDRGRHWPAGLILSTILSLAWITAVANGQMDPVVREQLLYPSLAKLAIVVFVALPWIISVRPAFKGKRTKQELVGLPRKYKLVGLGMIVVTAILPSLAFLNTAIRLGVDARVGYTQLRLADLLERRIELLERINMRPARVASDYAPLVHVLNSAWTLDPRADTPSPIVFGSGQSRPAAEMKVGDYRAGSTSPRRRIPRLIWRLLPQYSDSSIAVRELRLEEASDGMWRWWRKPQDLTLERVLVLDQATRERLYSKAAAGLPSSAKLIIRSAIPPATLQDRIFGRRSIPDFTQQLLCPVIPDPTPGTATGTKDPSPGRSASWPLALVLLLVASLTGGVLYQAVGFMGHRVFLFDVDEPVAPPEEKIKPVARLNFFVEVDDANADVVEQGSFHPIDAATIIPTQTAAWRSLLLEADKANKSGIVIKGFDEAFSEPWSAATLLSLLEELIALNRYSIVVLSQISIPAALATQNGENRDRWQGVFDAFARLNRRASAATESHESIWSSTSRAERLMLFQIARDGLANRKPAHILRRLLVRNLVHFAPQLEFKKPEFEAFVHKAARREGISDEESSPTPPHWQPLKVALAVLFVAAVILLLATQKDLINSTSAVITLLAAGIPVILRLVALVTGRPAKDLES